MCTVELLSNDHSALHIRDHVLANLTATTLKAPSTTGGAWTFTNDVINAVYHSAPKVGALPPGFEPIHC